MNITPNDNNQVSKPPIGVVIFCLYAFILGGIIPLFNSLIAIDANGALYSSILITTTGYFSLLLSFGIILSSIFALFGKNLARKTLLVLFSISQFLFLFSLVLKFPIGTGALNMQVFSCGRQLALIIFLFFFIRYFNRPSVKSFFNKS